MKQTLIINMFQSINISEPEQMVTIAYSYTYTYRLRVWIWYKISPVHGNVSRGMHSTYLRLPLFIRGKQTFLANTI